MLCPKCGAEVTRPIVKVTAKGMVETCDLCGAALGESAPSTNIFLKLGAKRNVKPAESDATATTTR